MPQSIVITPTYNEKENIREFIESILKVDDHVHVLVVDDKSPDGTGQIVKDMIQQTDRVHLIERDGLRGRGYADREGMKYAIDNGFDVIFQMDADFSHNPDDIPRFLEAIKDCDVVIGSRLVKGGGIYNRDWFRNIVTWFANTYIRLILWTKIKDCTTGYRCYRREVLATINLDKMFSPGPSLLEEILLACIKRRFKIKEIPIQFYDRKGGKSKLGLLEMIAIFFLILKIRIRNIS